MLESLDALILARAQFAFTVMFHIIFPAFSIGLASYLIKGLPKRFEVRKDANAWLVRDIA